MGKNEIEDKLRKKLSSIPESEEDIVYILSRVRKLLELKNYPSEFSILNFYCNLTLHAKITRPPKAVVDKLKKVRDATEDYAEALFDITHRDFHKQLDSFCKSYDIESFYSVEETGESRSKKLKKLNDLLLSVWSHTPIRIEYVEGFDCIIEQTPDGFFSVTIGPEK